MEMVLVPHIGKWRNRRAV